MAPAFSVRALVLHLPRRVMEGSVKLSVEEEAVKLLEAVDKASAEGALRPDSVRLVMPDTDPLLVSEVAHEVGEVAESLGVLVSLGGLPASARNLEAAVSDAAESGVYTHILLDGYEWAHAIRLARLLNSIAEHEPVNATRVGVNALGESVLTPFFPLASSPGDRALVTTALTYPNTLAEAYRSGGIEAVARRAVEAASQAMELARAVAQAVGAEAAGVDLSVAPWMNETTLGLVELVAGVRLPQPGIARGIHLVNRALRVASSEVKAVGFSEVQLPVAEDSKLKARASEGEVRAGDLARLSGVCLAGLDMAVIPYDENLVAGLILEVAAYARARGKPLGVRVIPLADVEPGDKIDLGRFGHTPVIPI